jgi:cell division control protein 6
MLKLLNLYNYSFKFIMVDLFKNYNSSNVEKTHPPKENLFDNLLNIEPIFDNKEILRHSFTPDELLHRDSEINTIASILVTALRGDTPSNILIYGKTGTGKTASVRYVSRELKKTSIQYNVPCDVEYINCEVVDTKYRILAQLANIS